MNRPLGVNSRAVRGMCTHIAAGVTLPLAAARHGLNPGSVIRRISTDPEFAAVITAARTAWEEQS